MSTVIENKNGKNKKEYTLGMISLSKFFLGGVSVNRAVLYYMHNYKSVLSRNV